MDVLAIAKREGKCPECGSRLEEDTPAIDDDDESLYEIQPVWCPGCGWEPY